MCKVYDQNLPKKKVQVGNSKALAALRQFLLPSCATASASGEPGFGLTASICESTSSVDLRSSGVFRIHALETTCGTSRGTAYALLSQRRGTTIRAVPSCAEPLLSGVPLFGVVM